MPYGMLLKPRPRVLSKWHKRLEAERQKRQACAFVKKRDGGKCRACGKPGNQAHHLVYRSKGGADDPNNLVYLCTHCHQLIHAKVLLVAFTEANPAKSVRFTPAKEWADDLKQLRRRRA